MIQPVPSITLPIPHDPREEIIFRQLLSYLGLVTEQLNSQVQGVGSVVASATSIALSAAIHHVSGTTAIQTIVVPARFTGPVFLIPDAVWTLITGGNIAKAATAVVSRLMTLIFDGTLWYPSYV